jgi:hypothetical protein
MDLPQTSSIPFEGKALVEFLCFVPEDPINTLFDSDPANVNNGIPLFRATVLVLDDRSPVMLQSTFTENF